jgi:hypothetical protein
MEENKKLILTESEVILEHIDKIYNFSSGFLSLNNSEATELLEAMTYEQAEHAYLVLEDYNSLLEFFGALNKASDAIGTKAANTAGTIGNIGARTGQALSNTKAVLGGIPKFFQGASDENRRIKNELDRKRIEYRQKFATGSVDDLANLKSEINTLKGQRGIGVSPFLPRLRSAEGYKRVFSKGAEASQIGKNVEINKKVADTTVNKNNANIQKRNEVYDKMYSPLKTSTNTTQNQPAAGNTNTTQNQPAAGNTTTTQNQPAAGNTTQNQTPAQKAAATRAANKAKFISRSNAAKKSWVSRNANKQKQQQMQAQTNQTLLNARAPQQFFNKAPGPKTKAKKPIPVRTTGYNKGKQSLSVRPNVKTKP